MIRVELAKLVRRPRSWVSLILLCGLPVLVAVFVAVTHLAPPPGQGPALLSAVLSSGSLYPAAALAIVLPIFLPVAVAVVAGDSIAGEAGSGTLRYLLARPVGRTRLLAAKLIALIVYTLSAVILIAVTAYLTGIALFGAQPVAATPGGLTTSNIAATSLSGSGLTPADIALRTVGAVAFIAVSMLGVGAIALFLSTVTDSALGAALGALAALITSEVLVTLNAASAVNPYLPTRYWLAWIDFFRDPIVWRNIERGFAVQGVYVVVFLAASWAHFATKDITSGIAHPGPGGPGRHRQPPGQAVLPGMRQRLGLAAALLRTPKLLILDEPTNGLDPQGIREIRDLLIELNAAGTTVFLSSHQLSEVEQLCTRVGIVNRGRLVRQDDLETLRALTGRSIVHTPDTDRAREVLNGQIERAESGRLVVADADTAALNSRLVASGVRVTEIAAERRSLEDVVLSVTGSGSDRVDVLDWERK